VEGLVVSGWCLEGFYTQCRVATYIHLDMLHIAQGFLLFADDDLVGFILYFSLVPLLNVLTHRLN